MACRPLIVFALLAALAGCASPRPEAGSTDSRPPTPTGASAPPRGDATALPPPPETSTGRHGAGSLPSATRQMVAAGHPLAAEVGREVLRAGGSAVDAAVAVQAVLGLVEPQSSGVGGGGFALLWDGKAVEAWDGRETAPLQADGRLFIDADGRPMELQRAIVGGRSVGTPGILRMLEAMHREHGRLPWITLFAPAIRLAENGFPIGARLARQIASDTALAGDAETRAYFFEPDGRPKAEGELLRNPALAATYRAIAEGGADAFYRGPTAREIVGKVRASTNPGLLDLADFERYETRRREPVCADYKRWRVCGMPPPSSGGVAVAQVLGMLARRNISVVPPVEVDGRLQPQPDAVHLLSEVERLAYADRALWLADADFVPVNLAGLLDAGYLARRAALVTDRSLGVAPAGLPPGSRLAFAPDASVRESGTSQISIVDAQGMAVSLTTSIEWLFGSRLMVRGFLLNNQLTDFSFLPEDGGRPVANRVEPGKRPRSSMAPTLVFERDGGRLVAVLGAPGGSQIIEYVAKTLVGLTDWGLDLQSAIDLPNFGSRNGPTELERGAVPASLAAALRERGHEVAEVDMTSGVQGIVVQALPAGGRLLVGGADRRRDGTALGD
ncbi:gamma-glutamyltransferase [Derxia gummosa]|uniref:Glutathione hydrolase proenzyme n=1 Tax=Derxia gummosa DSM 723 TaxID=1121388 RepID=A0A8B6X1I6_9BURK|nr:gamma-glutamyltransferase [Derxia gummosa]